MGGNRAYSNEASADVRGNRAYSNDSFAIVGGNRGIVPNSTQRAVNTVQNRQNNYTESRENRQNWRRDYPENNEQQNEAAALRPPVVNTIFNGSPKELLQEQ